MSTWQERVEEELNDLTLRLTALHRALLRASEGEIEIPKAQQDLMGQQAVAMAEYGDILKERLVLAEEAANDGEV